MEIAEKMKQPRVLVEWANNVVYRNPLTDDQKEISEIIDERIRKIGETGHDRDHEIAALVRRAFEQETVNAPSELLGYMFDEGNIGEFDDFYIENAPENTIQVYEAVPGGNVPASYVEPVSILPTWKELQAETYIRMSDMRRGGYYTVAQQIEYINQALENKKVSLIINMLNAAITSGNANYITESGTLPTETSADQLALYLRDMEGSNDTPVMFMLNKYRQAMSKLEQADRWPTDREKNAYNTDGFLYAYAGIQMIGFSGQKKLPDGSLMVPDKTIFGVAGKIGRIETRGEARVYEHEDINSEKVHIKVGGYTFGYAITDLDKVAKIVLA